MAINLIWAARKRLLFAVVARQQIALSVTELIIVAVLNLQNECPPESGEQGLRVMPVAAARAFLVREV